jgi:hypothetical protein
MPRRARRAQPTIAAVIRRPTWLTTAATHDHGASLRGAMTSCDRYWRAGVLLVERGEPDPHRDQCAACREAHAARDELVAVLSLVAATATGEPGWQARVWSGIEQLTDERRPAVSVRRLVASCIDRAIAGGRDGVAMVSRVGAPWTSR